MRFGKIKNLLNIRYSLCLLIKGKTLGKNKGFILLVIVAGILVGLQVNSQNNTFTINNEIKNDVEHKETSSGLTP